MRSGLVTSLQLGPVVHELRHRTLVMGVLGDPSGASFEPGLDPMLVRAEDFAAGGANILLLSRASQPVVPGQIDKELERAVAHVEALVNRFDLPVAIETSDARVLAAACEAGAVLGNDTSGLKDPGYVQAAAQAGASVIVTHLLDSDSGAEPAPVGMDAVSAWLRDRCSQALAAGLAHQQIAIEVRPGPPGTAHQSLTLLKSADDLASLGHPLVLSDWSTTLLGILMNLPVEQHGPASLAAIVYGMLHGCRVVRTYDVAATARLANVVERLLEGPRD